MSDAVDPVHYAKSLGYLTRIEEAGFKNLTVVTETVFPMAEQDERLRGKIVNIGVKAYK